MEPEFHVEGGRRRGIVLLLTSASLSVWSLVAVSVVHAAT